MIAKIALQNITLLLAVGLLASCSEPPQVGEIQAQRGTTITAGEEANLTVPVSGEELKFEWTALKGTIESSNRSAAIYKAPAEPGSDTVTVTVTYRGGEVMRHITFDVVAPTVEPTATLPPTAAPEPLACELRQTTRDLFPQIYQEFGLEGQFPTYGPVPGDAGSENFRCEVVPNPDTNPDSNHKPSQTVHITYQKVTDNSGWWGIATPSGYDASQHNQFCFWAYAKQPASFRVKMKDTSLKEDGYVVTVETANEWRQICTDITKFEEMGINTQQMDNVNLGFEAPWDSAEVWVADLEFK